MNQQAFESGKRAYQEADWLRAATLLEGAKQPGELSGEVDHLRGNAYMKLGRYDEAARAYEAALADAAYGKRGALSCNRGRALLAAGRPQDAVGALTDAVADSSYATPYKAYMALGTAYEQLGDVRNAGIAYRSAAIDEQNPSPAVALSDLGSCFMRLGRAVDAVEAYRTALDFTTPLEDQNGIWCDLALAYVAANRMNEAVDAFAHATADGTYALSPEAQASYDAARKAVASISSRRPSETDALLAAAGYGTSYDPLDPTGASGELMPSPEDTGFFSVSEEDLVQQDRLDRKVRRKHRHTGLKVFLVIFILLALVAGAGAFAYVNGYGWPTQQAVAEQLFDAKSQGSDLAPYVSSELSTAQVQEISDIIPSGAEISVTGVDRSMTDSTVYLTATLSGSGEQDYTIDLVRDGIGWKVSAVTPVYLSEDAGTDAPDTTGGADAQDDASADQGDGATGQNDASAQDGTTSTDPSSTPESSSDQAGAEADAGTDVASE